MTSESPIDSSLLEWAEYWYPVSWKGLLVLGAVTAIAAVGTIIFFALQWRTTVIRERQGDWRTAQLEIAAGNANERAAKLEKQAAESNERAKSLEKAIAEANARQKEAELKVAFLEKKVVPRVINPDGAAAIVEKLKQLPPMPFAIESDPAAEYGFVNSLVELLQKIGWKWQSYSASLVTIPMGNIEMSNSNESGVQIRINRARLADFKDAAQALAFALTGALSASVGPVVDPPNSPAACSPDAIHIEIRRKL